MTDRYDNSQSDTDARASEPFNRERIPLHRASIGAEELGELRNCLTSGWLTKGPLTARFEREFAAYLSRDRARGDGSGNADTPDIGKEGLIALGLNSCTAALHTALFAAGIGPGDEVITTPMTFAASLNVIEHVGATPVIVDVHPDTLCINEKLVKAKLSLRTRAIIPVHYAGHPCEMETIMRIARERKLAVIEDCAHAVEAEYRGQPVGTFGGFGCFSFYATKNMTTGEGGMLVCRDAEALERARVFSLHGMSSNAWQRYSGKGFRLYDIEVPGFKYNMFDMQAALGLNQLKKIDGWHSSRKWLYERYCELLEDLPFVEPLRIRPNVKSAYHLMVIKLDTYSLGIERNEFVSRMLAENVQCYVHYKPIFEMSYYRGKYGWSSSDYPVAADAGGRIVTLPFYPTMDEDEIRGVVGAMKKIADELS